MADFIRIDDSVIRISRIVRIRHDIGTNKATIKFLDGDTVLLHMTKDVFDQVARELTEVPNGDQNSHSS